MREVTTVSLETSEADGQRTRWWRDPAWPSERTTRKYIILGSVATLITLILTALILWLMFAGH